MTLKVGIFGASGLVGDAMRRILEERKFPLGELRLFASERSQGETRRFQGRSLHIEALNEERLKGLDVVLASLPGPASLEWNKKAEAQGAWVIDNSSAFRMDPKVALVVPEVNSAAIGKAFTAHNSRIIANPNCSTIQMLVALNPLHKKARVKRIVVSTYQASSGKGKEAMDELTTQANAFVTGGIPAANVHAGRLFGSLLTNDWTLTPSGMNEEEAKIVAETKKIWDDATIQVAPTTVRVPVWNAHSESIAVEFHDPITVDEAKSLLGQAPGVRFTEDPSEWNPIFADGKDEVIVGRVRLDETVKHGLMLWTVGDNLRKGAALNAVQIAETLRAQSLLK